mmetsp:Transcript_7576/g.24694  ORF Transcript_7576/g.24694 Transcript_7576/m.24694 type:complete len:248 (-) Transcript_7576:653-1396(-)
MERGADAPAVYAKALDNSRHHHGDGVRRRFRGSRANWRACKVRAVVRMALGRGLGLCHCAGRGGAGEAGLGPARKRLARRRRPCGDVRRRRSQRPAPRCIRAAAARRRRRIALDVWRSRLGRPTRLFCGAFGRRRGAARGRSCVKSARLRRRNGGAADFRRNRRVCSLPASARWLPRFNPYRRSRRQPRLAKSHRALARRPTHRHPAATPSPRRRLTAASAATKRRRDARRCGFAGAAIVRLYSKGQ